MMAKTNLFKRRTFRGEYLTTFECELRDLLEESQIVALSTREEIGNAKQLVDRINCVLPQVEKLGFVYTAQQLRLTAQSIEGRLNHRRRSAG